MIITMYWNRKNRQKEYERSRISIEVLISIIAPIILAFRAMLKTLPLKAATATRTIIWSRVLVRKQNKFREICFKIVYNKKENNRYNKKNNPYFRYKIITRELATKEISELSALMEMRRGHLISS